MSYDLIEKISELQSIKKRLIFLTGHSPCTGNVRLREVSHDEESSDEHPDDIFCDFVQVFSAWKRLRSMRLDLCAPEPTCERFRAISLPIRWRTIEVDLTLRVSSTIYILKQDRRGTYSKHY